MTEEIYNAEAPLLKSVLVVMPTYDERENIQAIVPAILAAVPRAAVWIVDDNSPDGTGDLADALAAADTRVKSFHRPEKAGLGTAYADSFPKALAAGYDLVVEMDSDFSHDPTILPDLLRTAQTADLVLGSRYVPGGSTPDWTMLRRFISRIGNIVAHYVLGVPVHDATTGYRVFSSNALRSLRLEGVKLQGYGFQIETVFQCHRNGLVIREHPICFIDRRQGQSKMSRAIVIEALGYVFRRRFKELLARRSVHQPERVRDHNNPTEAARGHHEDVEPQAPA